jgi:hypothetical protein
MTGRAVGVSGLIESAAPPRLIFVSVHSTPTTAAACMAAITSN